MPNQISWDNVAWFIAGELVIILLWILIEWIAQGKRKDD
jgi:hypothetical protein